MLLIYTCGNCSLVVDTTLTVTCTGVRCVWPAGTSAMGISVSPYDPLKLLRKLPSKWEISNYRVTRWLQKQWYMYIYWAKWSFVFSLWDLYRIYLPNLPSIFTFIFIKKKFSYGYEHYMFVQMSNSHFFIWSWIVIYYIVFFLILCTSHKVCFSLQILCHIGDFSSSMHSLKKAYKLAPITEADNLRKLFHAGE